MIEIGTILTWKGEVGTGARWECISDGQYKYLGSGFSPVGHIVIALHDVGNPKLWDVEEPFDVWVRQVRKEAQL